MRTNFLKSTVLALMIFLAISLQSCTNNDPSLANLQLDIKATSSLSTFNPGGRVMQAGVVYTDVMVGLTKMEFESAEEIENESKNGEGSDDELEYKGAYKIDVLAGTSVPELSPTDIAPGIYEEMKFNLGPILDGNQTLFIAFDYAPDDKSPVVRYEYSNNDELEFKIESDAGFQLDEGTLNNFLIVFNLDSIFNNVDLASATIDSDGVVRINADSNQSIAAQIAQNLHKSMDGGEDENDDGEIDD